MKKTPLLAVCLLVHIAIFSQSLVNNNWYFGTGDGITFNNGTAPISLLTDGQLANGPQGHLTTACVSDNSGNLLFYTDGRTIWNRMQQPMPTALNGIDFNLMPEQVVIIPDLTNSQRYYIFTAYNSSFSSIDKYYYAIVDMNQDGGFGDIVQNETPLLEQSGFGVPQFENSAKRIAYHYNAGLNVIWITVLNDRQILTYRMDSSGFNPNPVQVSTNVTFDSMPILSGGMRISPDGTRIAMTLRLTLNTSFVDAVIADFDATTGAVTNRQPIFISSVDDLEFSPDSNNLFLRGIEIQKSGSKTSDLTNTKAVDGKTLEPIGPVVNPTVNQNNGKIYKYPAKNNVKTLDPEILLEGIGPYGSLQTGLDGRIYFNSYLVGFSDVHVGVIENPNEPVNANIIIDPTSILVGTNPTLSILFLSLPREVINLSKQPLPLDPFIATFRVGPLDRSVTIPTINSSSVNYNYTVDWGDGTTSTNITGNVTHTYATEGDYDVSITGTFPRIYFGDNIPQSDRDKLIGIESWGNNNWESMRGAFSGCTNLVYINPNSAPDLSNVTSMHAMFSRCENLNQNINHWDVSTVTQMDQLFLGAHRYNQPLDNWDVSKVTNMHFMFREAFDFDQPLNDWDVVSVIDMGAMFSSARAFNQPLNNWNVSSVENMGSMFGDADSFNQSLEDWNVISVTNMRYMFQLNDGFNGNLNNWQDKLINVENMEYMFRYATAFNKPINNWNVSNVTNMEGLFFHAESFNQPLNNWNVSSVTNMKSIFYHAYNFNRPLNNWNVINVTNMNGAFLRAQSFNHPLNDWDVDNVIDASAMFFQAYNFNQPLNNWNVSNVTNMRVMFLSAGAFDQSLGSWDVRNVTNMDAMLRNAGLSIGNYEATIIGWNNLPSLQNNILFGVDGLKYCSSTAIAARQNIINTRNWTFSGDTQACSRGAQSKELSIYPSPFSSFINIQLDNSEHTISQVVMYNKLGTIVHQQKVKSTQSTVEMNTSKLPRGIYFVKSIFSDGTSEVKQVIKN